MNTWLSGMSPGSTTSGAFGSTPPASVVVGIGTVVAGVGAVVVAGNVVGGAVSVVALCAVVVDCSVLLTVGVEVDELSDPLHADAPKDAASTPAAIIDLMRIIQSLLGLR
jgi:hypothetical protein